MDETLMERYLKIHSLKTRTPFRSLEKQKKVIKFKKHHWKTPYSKDEFNQFNKTGKKSRLDNLKPRKEVTVKNSRKINKTRKSEKVNLGESVGKMFELGPELLPRGEDTTHGCDLAECRKRDASEESPGWVESDRGTTGECSEIERLMNVKEEVTEDDYDTRGEDSEDDKETVVFDESLVERRLPGVADSVQKMKRGKIIKRKKQKLVKFKRKRKMRKKVGKVETKEQKTRAVDVPNVEILEEVCRFVKDLHDSHKIIQQLKKDMPKNAELASHFKTVISTEQENFRREIWRNRDRIVRGYEKLLANCRKPKDIAQEIGRRIFLSPEEVENMIYQCKHLEELCDRERDNRRKEETGGKFVGRVGADVFVVDYSESMNKIHSKDSLKRTPNHVRGFQNGGAVESVPVKYPYFMCGNPKTHPEAIQRIPNEYLMESPSGLRNPSRGAASPYCCDPNMMPNHFQPSVGSNRYERSHPNQMPRTPILPLMQSNPGSPYSRYPSYYFPPQSPLYSAQSPGYGYSRTVAANRIPQLSRDVHKNYLPPTKTRPYYPVHNRDVYHTTSKRLATHAGSGIINSFFSSDAFHGNGKNHVFGGGIAEEHDPRTSDCSLIPDDESSVVPPEDKVLDPTIPQKLTMKNQRLQAGDILEPETEITILSTIEEETKGKSPFLVDSRSRVYECAEESCKNQGVKVCDGCHSAIYCSDVCKLTHWTWRHKEECHKLKELRG